MFKLISFFLIVFSKVLLPIKFIESMEFSYSNQNNWNQQSPNCGLRRQSPIELWNPEYTIRKSMPPINFKNYDTYLSAPLIYQNNGHTVNIIPNKNRNIPTLSGKELPGKFVLEQFHFHWGSKDNIGSEHTIHGKRYGMELHLVHRNTKYKTINEALEYEDGLVVIGILYKVRNLIKSYNFGIGNILFNLPYIRKYSQKIKSYVSFKLQDLFQHIDLNNYFLYKGSLTTPPCYEAVTWIVMRQTEYASTFQLNFFRKLIDNSGNLIINNYRYLQKVERRKVFFNNH